MQKGGVKKSFLQGPDITGQGICLPKKQSLESEHIRNIELKYENWRGI